MANQQTALDVEDESILSTIFKDAFPESWRENPDFAHYLAELSSYGVDKLNREPERLSEERANILEQTQDLAFHNYKTFIQTAECSRDIFQDFQIIEKHVDSVLDKLPLLSNDCNQFMKKAQELNISRRMNNVTLQRHTQLLEVLEMPQLMDTCVRNGYYEEALELASHVKRLEKKHANIPVIQNIVSEVRNSTQLMLNHLIQQLRTNVQLPACLRVIGYLRRMDVFTEAELRIKFLQARDAWFQNILLNIPRDDAYYHITKTIEASRVHLFDIITQYRAIFSDEDPLLSSSRDEGPNEGALFHGWVVQKVSQFIQTLEQDLQRGVGGRLDSLLGQCMYFGLSFSRVGADFRGLLAPIFQRAALAGFSHAVAQANHRFDETMESYTLLGTPSMLPSSAFQLASQTSGVLQPPIVLLEYQPLAAYCNHLLSAYNDLRLCAPLSLACDVANQTEDSLKKAVDVLLAYHRAEETTFNPQEHDRFGELCRVFVEELVPHVNKCLQSMFPPTLLAQTLGVPVSDLLRLGNIGSINPQKITEPIAHLVPAKPEPELPVTEEVIGADTSETGKHEETNQSEETQNAEPSQSEEVTQVAESSQSEEVSQVAESSQSEMVFNRAGEELEDNKESAESTSEETVDTVREVGSESGGESQDSAPSLLEQEVDIDAGAVVIEGEESGSSTLQETQEGEGTKESAEVPSESRSEDTTQDS